MQNNLDNLLSKFLKSLSEILGKQIRAAREANDSTVNTQLRIDLNDRALTWETKSKHGKPLEVTKTDLDAAGMPDLVTALRGVMPEIAWPITLHLSVEGIDRHGSSWPQVICGGIGAANWQMTPWNRSSPLMRKARSGFAYEGGLDAIAEGLTLVAEICPPTNREVRSWSSISYLMTEFCHNENIHARSEAEFLLKIRLFHEGVDAIREVIRTGVFAPRNNEDGLRFTSIDLENLGEDPRGTRVRSADIFASLTKSLEPQEWRDPDAGTW